MYEDQTYETILERMLDRVPDNIDKREGSIIYDTLAPVAAELAQSYIDLDTVLNLTFAKTSDGEFLDMRTEESGIERDEATSSIRKGVFNIDVPIDSKFRGGDVVYRVIEQMDTGVFQLEAETAGSIGNDYFGNLIPIDSIEGLTSAELQDVLIPGEDEETDEALYDKYIEEINSLEYGGNIDQYEDWISEIGGVGRFKIDPLWNGRGTVKGIITDVNNQVPSQILVDSVQETLDPFQDGKGFGLVPIGHIFTTVGAIAKNVDFDMTIVFEEGYGSADVQSEVEQIIDEYFREINFQNTTIRQAVLISRILNLSEVKDVTQLLLNNTDGNITLENEEVAERGTVTIDAG